LEEKRDPSKALKKPDYIPYGDERYLTLGFFSRIIDFKNLIQKDPQLLLQLKTEELTNITDVIKDLFTELREGDEVEVTEALTDSVMKFLKFYSQSVKQGENGS
jgi:hypothetical protein